MNWMKYRYLYFALSLAILIPGIYSLFRYGLKLSIEFTGGSVLELQNVSLSEEEVRNRLNAYELVSLSQNNSGYRFQFKSIDQEKANIITASLASSAEATPSVVDFATVGPVLGQETMRKTLIGIALASTVILIFIARAFKEIKYGVSAVIAMFHDTFILIGIFSLLGRFFNLETDLLFVTAVLTTLSFSVHDTIVVYDRIRELSRTYSHQPTESIANRAITETIVRSLNNSLTIVLMLLALVLLGGESTRNFALALLIGVIAGTYSSPFIATPILVIWDQIANRRKRG